MTGLRSWFRRRLLGIAAAEATGDRRGFRRGDPRTRRRLDEIGRTFLEGYHAALEEPRPAALGARLETVDPERRGFAFEGAAMGLALLDRVWPARRGRFRDFVGGPGASHVYMVHVGAGWAWARLRRRIDRVPAGFDPLLGWLAVDGYGFHEGFFHWPRAVVLQEVPDRISGYARRAFDQGLGRSLWFVNGAEPARLAATIAGFPSPRAGDLWSGVGLAAAYAGGVDREVLEALAVLAGRKRPQLAQGAAFAAQARERAGNPTEATEMACEVLCGLRANEAARLTVEALVDLPLDGEEPGFEVWRGRIRERFTDKVLIS